MTATEFDIRPVRREDVGAIHAMIGALARFELLSDLCVATFSDIEAALFAPRPSAEALIATAGGEPAGFALFFHGFSTFRGRRTLWLEDLFVHPAWRGQGCAGALTRALAALALERNCCRFEWAVLDWNGSAIDFYRRLGATVLSEWRIVRVDGPALTDLAGGVAEK